MILAVDVGNSQIVTGCLGHDRTIFTERLSTVWTKTELEYAVDFKTVLDIHKMDPAGIDGAVIASVVPQITGIIGKAVRKILPRGEIITLGPGIRTGLNILMDNPGSVGADLVAAAVAGLKEYPLPLIMIDMGTATTVTVLNGQGSYIGGMIYPGVRISLDALTSRASQLSGISIEAPRKVIGKNTINSMKSGIIFSNAAALDGVIDRIEDELGEKVHVVATGGLADRIIPYCRREITLDQDLILKGLRIIYEKNAGHENRN